ncbi:hypothetical protein GAO09_04860 [Rhizobiales bacterium RZME27]|uniref:Uncharacterized protein n=1 Tax=Endobacterium cereale TaxID=2663029 RepID=A0A6A8A2S6_9HYPH|nr:hypothetical protein [Endobacterium cereale]MEB2846522.1 hypothetical protein [Endobacterium cereale]MQY45395.1 hypothetical protein [Endobacterium cereale]
MNQQLRWLLPPERDRWVGYHEGDEVAEVWSHGLTGNQIAEWRWRLLPDEQTGSEVATGDEDQDCYRAQRAASAAYFSMH